MYVHRLENYISAIFEKYVAVSSVFQGKNFVSIYGYEIYIDVYTHMYV